MEVTIPSAVTDQAAMLAPGPPQKVVGASLGGDGIELSWEAPPDAPSAIFRIYWDRGLGYRMYALKTSVRGSSYVATGLNPSTTYRYFVTTYDGRRESTPAPVTVRTFSWLSLPLARLTAAGPPGVVSLGTPVSTPTPQGIQDPTQASEVMLGLMGTNDYVDDLGALHLVGEVHNHADQNVDGVRVRVTFYDEEGNALHAVTGSALLDLLAPEQRSPFVIVWDSPGQWKRYSLQATARPTTERPSGGVTLLHSYARLDDDGLYHVVGTIRNDGLTTAHYLRVVVSLYDSFGRIANAGFAYAQPPRIPPGATGSFDCLFDHYPYLAEHVVQIAHR